MALTVDKAVLTFSKVMLITIRITTPVQFFVFSYFGMDGVVARPGSPMGSETRPKTRETATWTVATWNTCGDFPACNKLLDLPKPPDVLARGTVGEQAARWNSIRCSPENRKACVDVKADWGPSLLRWGLKRDHAMLWRSVAQSIA